MSYMTGRLPAFSHKALFSHRFPTAAVAHFDDEVFSCLPQASGRDARSDAEKTHCYFLTLQTVAALAGLERLHVPVTYSTQAVRSKKGLLNSLPAIGGCSKAGMSDRQSIGPLFHLQS